eukprot:TRINITY_DN12183_c0_g1_i8.p1 TRINITY_DN12183_c0_g1~~TRINITY_DN12183_c0_g1_i8.p1  ORF type:complete len:472 (+),score=75.46 TRINITY_DN12183_c0_g1_i8:901-2316(+)
MAKTAGSHHGGHPTSGPRPACHVLHCPLPCHASANTVDRGRHDVPGHGQSGACKHHGASLHRSVHLGYPSISSTLRMSEWHHPADRSHTCTHAFQFPLLVLVRPDVARDIVHSLVGMYKEGGDIPRWPICNVYAGCMIATHGNVLISDLVSKNASGDVDLSAAYEGMYLQATDPNRPHISRQHLDDYVSKGYVTESDSSKSVSLTLAYAYDDAVLSSVAKTLGLVENASYFEQRSQSYQNAWDASKGYFCQRSSDGEFGCALDPTLHTWVVGDENGFCEGNEAEWRWFVPHDLEGLMQLFPSTDAYVKALQSFFQDTEKDTDTDLPNPHYWAGNEPGIMTPYQFSVAKRADLTQWAVHTVINQSYNTQPHGIPGNDDYGTLSAWLVFSMLGFYPRAGFDDYFLGTPAFARVDIELAQFNKTFTIAADGLGRTNYLVANCSLDDKPVDMISRAYITHQDLDKHSTLRFDMQN